ncbi:membrane protein-like protein [Burkholderia sp. H160]|nr:membrane protein-like protein [Burkholderia sp. H160]
MPNASPYLPLAYIPQAIGLRIGQTMDLGVGTSYRLARTASLVAIAALLTLSFQIFRPNALVLCILALPMTMFQIVSATQDGISIAWLILSVSLFRRGIEREQTFPSWMGVLLIISTFLVISSRPQLFPIALFPASIFWLRNDRRALAATAIAALNALAWIINGLGVVNMIHIRTMTAGQILSMYSHHPVDLIAVFARTLTDPGYLAFYWHWFVGIPGWLDTPMPASIYKLSAVALIVAAAISFSREVSRCARWLPIFCAVTAIGLAFFAMLITWTDQPAQFIDGVQGRYFTAPAVLIAYALGGQMTSATRAMAREVVWGGFLAVSGFLTTSTVLWRYYLGM